MKESVDYYKYEWPGYTIYVIHYKNVNNSEQLKFRISNFLIHNLCQNTYLSSPYTSTDTMRYDYGKKCILSIFFLLCFPGLTQDTTHQSFCINPLSFIERRSMACYFRYHDGQ